MPGSIRVNEDEQESYVAKLSRAVVKFINVNYYQNGKVPVNEEPLVEDLDKKKELSSSQDTQKANNSTSSDDHSKTTAVVVQNATVSNLTSAAIDEKLLEDNHSMPINIKSLAEKILSSDDNVKINNGNISSSSADNKTFSLDEQKIAEDHTVKNT